MGSTDPHRQLPNQSSKWRAEVVGVLFVALHRRQGPGGLPECVSMTYRECVEPLASDFEPNTVEKLHDRTVRVSLRNISSNLLYVFHFVGGSN